MTDIDELERIVKAGDRYGHNTPGVTLELIAEVRELRKEAREHRRAALEEAAKEMRRRATENANTIDARACYANAENAIRALARESGEQG